MLGGLLFFFCFVFCDDGMNLVIDLITQNEGLAAILCCEIRAFLVLVLYVSFVSI